MKKLFVEITNEMHNWLRLEKVKRNSSIKAIVVAVLEKEMKKKKK